MPIDNFGREIPNLNPSDLLGGTKTTQEAKNADISGLANLLSSMSTKYDASLKKMESMFNTIVSYMKNAQSKNDKANKSSTFQEKMLKLMTNEYNRHGGAAGAKRMDDLVKHGLKKGSIYVADIMSHKLLRDVKSILKVQVSGRGKIREHELLSPRAYGRLYKPYVGEEAVKLPADAGKKPSNIEAFGKMAISKEFLNAFDKIEESFFSLGEKAKSINETLWGGKTALTGLVKPSQDFALDMKQALYQTQGITNASDELLKNFVEIKETSYLTGQSTQEFMKNYTKNVKSGIRDQKIAEKLTVAQLNAERQLGLEAGDLNDTFRDFALVSRFSTVQISAIGRGMQEAARSAGLTGTALKDAMTSSQKIVNMMRDAGQLTTKSTANITSMMASFKKFGVAEQGAKMAEYMADSTKLLMQGSDETATLLYKSAGYMGKIEELQTGTLLKTPEGIKSIGQGMDKVLREFGINSIEEIDNLSDVQRRNINLTMKSIYGVQLDEFVRLRNSYMEAGKGLSEKLGDINAKLNKNITDSERLRLEEQKRSLSTTAIMGFLGELDKVAPDAQNMQDALKKMGPRMNEFTKDLETIKGGGFADEADKIKYALTKGVEEVNKGFEAAGLADQKLQIDEAQITKALSDPKLFQELVEKINKGQQQLTTDQQSLIDPALRAQQLLLKANDFLTTSINNLNETMKRYIGVYGYLGFAGLSVGLQSVVSALGSLAGFLAFFGYKITDMGGMLYGLGGRIASLFGSLFSFFGRGGGFLSSLTSIFSRTGSFFTSLTNFFTRGFSGFITRSFLRFLGPIGAVFQAVTGFFKGGISGMFSTLFTGGTGTGSFLSDMFGIQKGSSLDIFLSIMGALFAGGATGFMVGGPIGAIVGAIGGAIGEIFKIVTGNLSWKEIWDAIGNIGKWMWESVTGAFSGIGTFIYDNITGAFSGLATWFNNNILKPLWSLLPDWLTKGGGKAVEGISDIAEGKIIEGGTKVVTGTAEAVDAGIAAGVAQASRAVGAPEFAKGVEAAAQESGGLLAAPGRGLGDVLVAGGAAHVYNAMADYLPWSWLGYAEGTRQVKNEGLAMLHQGEIVVPKNEADIMRAIGAGGYDSATNSLITKAMYGLSPVELSSLMMQFASVPSSPMNQLIATNTIKRSQMANVPADGAGTSDVEEKNSEDILSTLQRIASLLERQATASAGTPYVGKLYRAAVDTIYGNINGGDFTKSDVVNAF